MSKQSKKKAGSWKLSIPLLFYCVIGFLCGFVTSYYMNKMFSQNTQILTYAVLFSAMILAILLQILIHEAGHLVFGLLSGYKFSSFRIFSFMLLKEKGKLKLKRLSVAGTGGQCLLVPPDMVDGKIPIVLYNLGGSILNIIAGVIFFVVAYFSRTMPILLITMLIFAIVGFALALMNGIPMRMGLMDNDGYNAIELTRTPKALKAFWCQLKINEQVAKGIRLKDMPAEWFEVPSDEDMKNSMVATIAVFACNRLMDMKQFEEADNLMTHLLEIDSGIVDIYKKGMVCDQLYIEMTRDNRREVIEKMLTTEQKTFMKQMKSNPGVIRTEYLLALFYDNDNVKAEKIKARFEKCAKSYPHQGEIQSERELIAVAGVDKAETL